MARESDRRRVQLYLDESRRRVSGSDAGGAVRVLSSVVEENPGRHDLRRLAGYRLLDLGQGAQAAQLFQRVQFYCPLDPHAHRDLARVLETVGKLTLAALHYEIVLAGTGTAVPAQAVKQAAREDYARLVRDLLASPGLRPELRAFFERRLDELGPIRTHKDLRVSITWNNELADVDLWVTDPDGRRVSVVGAQGTAAGEPGAERHPSCGPERYQLPRARPAVPDRGPALPTRNAVTRW